MSSSLIAELQKEIAAAEESARRLPALKAALAALTGSNGGAAPQKPGPKARRAPPGHLEDEMEKVIKAHPGLTNLEVRTRLEKGGYAYSLSSLHVGKRLSGMVDDKRLTVKLDGNKRRYYPAK